MTNNGHVLRPLKDLVVFFDSRRVPIKTSDRVPGPYPYYGASGVVDHVDSFIFEGLHLLVSEDGENLRSRSTPVAFLAEGRFWVNNHAHVLVGNNQADTRFLAYAVETSDISGYLTGTAQPKLSQAALASLLVVAPPLSEQRAIAEVLGALDDAIAASQRMARLSDEVRITEFASASTSTGGVLLTEAADFVNGRNFTKGASGEGRPVVRIAELNTGLGASTVYSDVEAPAQHVVDAGDLLFAWSGSLTLRRWYLDKGLINQHIFKVLPRDRWPLWLVGCLLDAQLPEYKAIAADKATTMGHIQRKHLDVVIPAPDKEWLEKNSARMSGLWSTALAAEMSAVRLVTLRDALLPELMSGRMRVKDAQQRVEEAI